MPYKVNGLPWGGKLGIDVQDCNTSEEVIKKAGLDFFVEKCELVAKMPFSINGDNSINDQMGDFSYGGSIYRECPNGYATYRTDKNIPLGIVKSKYEVIQNIDAFNFINSAIGEDKAIFQKAGCFGYGHKVFITAKLPISTTVGGDPIDNYLVFSTSHDGSGSIDILFTPVRMLCLNMLNSSIEESSSHIRIKHTKTAKDRLDFGAEMLKIAIEYAKSSQLLYESLLTIKMTDDQVRDYIARLQLNSNQYNALTECNKDYNIRKLFDKDYITLQRNEISTQKSNTINTIFDYYKNGIAQEPIVGSAWGAYNAITGYYSNIKNQEGEKRMNNLIFGNDRLATSKALNLVMQYKEAI
jgi:phage/plasmid-like protein (TIGR03299 family)